MKKIQVALLLLSISSFSFGYTWKVLNKLGRPAKVMVQAGLSEMPKTIQADKEEEFKFTGAKIGLSLSKIEVDGKKIDIFESGSINKCKGSDFILLPDPTKENKPIAVTKDKAKIEDGNYYYEVPLELKIKGYISLAVYKTKMTLNEYNKVKEKKSELFKNAVFVRHRRYRGNRKETYYTRVPSNRNIIIDYGIGAAGLHILFIESKDFNKPVDFTH